MKVKFNGEMSDFLSLVGGSPQATLIGQLEYILQSNDNADIVCPEDRMKYIDDLSVLHLVCLSGLLVEYNFTEHVASDISLDQKFLPPSSYETQDTLNYISNWTNENLMKLNAGKCSYMVFTKSQDELMTRLTINNTYLEKVNVSKLLGVWISKDIPWSNTCQEMCRKAYSRLSIITKLKYTGAKLEDLLDICTVHRKHH